MGSLLRPQSDGYYSVKEVADILGISTGQVLLTFRGDEFADGTRVQPKVANPKPAVP